MQTGQTASSQQRETTLNKRLEDIGWGLFLVMIGLIWLVPNEQIPQGTWLIGTGLILLGLNAVRYFKGIRLGGFTIVLGIIALCAGLGSLFGVKLPLFAIFLILIGASLILRPFIGRED